MQPRRVPLPVAHECSEHRIVGTVPAGVFPRELTVTANHRTLLLTNFGSRTLAAFDTARLPIVPSKN
jgi:hypothetical protein